MLRYYNLISLMGTELSFVDYKEVKNTIEKKFSNNCLYETEDNESAFQEVGINDDSLHIYYLSKNIEVLIDDKLKSDFESKTKFRLEDVK